MGTASGVRTLTGLPFPPARVTGAADAEGGMDGVAELAVAAAGCAEGSSSCAGPPPSRRPIPKTRASAMPSTSSRRTQ